MRESAIKLKNNYEDFKGELDNEYGKALCDLTNLSILKTQEIKKLDEELKSLKDKQDAYIKAKLREESIKNQESFYKMTLDSSFVADIKILREQVQPLISNKDSIDKIIWENYYKTEYDKLMNRLFGNIEKQCGIYKLTCLITDKIYIGQSVDMRTRMKDHIKAGLSHSPASNKLYSEMQKYGCENFTFEILEIVSRDKLNKRESYWIDFYRTKEYGLNGTKGNN